MDYPKDSPADMARKLADNKDLQEAVIEAEKLREQLEKSKVLAEGSQKPEVKSMSLNPDMPPGKAVITPAGPPGEISEGAHEDWKKAIAKYFASPHAYSPNKIRETYWNGRQLSEIHSTDAGSAVPEIWASEVVALSEYQAVLRRVVLEDQTLRGKPGDALNITTLAHFTASKFSQGTAPTAISPVVGGLQVQVTEGGCYLPITKTLQEDAIPGLIQRMNKRMAEANERMIDSDILNCLQNTTGFGALAGTLTEAGKMAATVIAKALGSIRAGTYEPYALIIHTTQEASLLQEEAFTNAAKYGNRDVIKSGRVYDYLGVMVVPTPLAPVTNGTYSAFLISEDSVILAGKRDMTVETDYDPTTRTTHVVNSMRYGTAIQHPKGIFTILTVNG